MTDLDTRIRSYVDGWLADQDAPPNFDDAVARAVATRRRPLTGLWAGLAAACVVALAVLATIALPSHPRPRAQVAASHGAASTPRPEVSRAESSLASVRVSEARVLAVLKVNAMKAAARYGDVYATARAVHTTRLKASTPESDRQTGPDRPIWLIQLTGHFATKDSTGRYLRLLVPDTTGGRVTYSAPSDTPVDLAELGAVVTLLP